MTSIFDRLQLNDFLLSGETYHGVGKYSFVFLTSHDCTVHIVGTLRRKTQELQVVESPQDIIS